MKKTILKSALNIISFLLFTTIGYSQFTMSEFTDDCIGSDSGCTANSIEITNAYIGNGDDGSAITDCSDIHDINDVWIMISVSKNGKKHDLLAQFYLTDVKAANPTPELKKYVYYTSSAGIETGFYKTFKIDNYCINGDVDKLYSLNDVLVSWDTSGDGVAICPDISTSQCNGDIPDIIVEGPFSAGGSAPNILCFGEDTTANIVASGGTQPYTITISDNPSVQNIPFDGNEDFQITASSIITVSDSNNHSETFTINVNETQEIIETNSEITIDSGDLFNESLIDNVNVPSTFSWQAVSNANIDGETTTVSTSDTITNTLINLTSTLQTVVYVVTPTSTPDGCVGDDFTITVHVTPNA
ncbi:PKD-like domain-containing protein, partial [Lutibacter sp. TH_r2]|uniref:PKD-like domain-containing protein n=1 Tax=Lutibacter sp. TH_r2 TaxID=3082083 RepID=UPI002954C5B9